MEFRDPSRILLIFIFKDRSPEKLQVAIEKTVKVSIGTALF